MAQAVKAKTPKTGGDDLDDALELDPNLLASDDEVDSTGSGDEHDDEVEGNYEGVSGDNFVSDDDEPEEGDEHAQAEGSGAAARKRKAEEVEAGDDDEETLKADRRKRKREKDKERKAKRQQNTSSNTSSTPSTPPTLLTPSQFSSLLLSSIRETFPSATAMEIDDLLLPSERLLSPSQFVPPVDDDGTKGMLKRIEGIVKSGKGDYLNSYGMPRVLVLCLSGMRCVDVVRLVKGVKGKGEVVKLFAKHLKVADQIKQLSSTNVSIAVGTPSRVAKLISEDGLKLSKSTVVLLDIGHRDSKTRTLLTLPEIRTELWKSLFSGEVRRRMIDAGVHFGAV